MCFRRISVSNISEYLPKWDRFLSVIFSAQKQGKCALKFLNKSINFFVIQDEDFRVEDDDDEEPAAAGMKQARRNDQYTLCIKFGLAGISTRFGLTAEQVRLKCLMSFCQYGPLKLNNVSMTSVFWLIISKNLDLFGGSLYFLNLIWYQSFSKLAACYCIPCELSFLFCFQFAENLHDNYQKHDVEQDPSEPLEVAAEYVNDKYTSPELVKIFLQIFYLCR